MTHLALVGLWPKALVNGTHGGVEQRAIAVCELHPLVVISILISFSFTHKEVVVTPLSLSKAFSLAVVILSSYHSPK